MIILDEYLTIGAVDLATPAYFTESLAPLYRIQKRGSNRPLPGRMRPYRRVSWEVSAGIVVNVRGQYAADGSTNADPYAGLDGHLRYLEDELLEDVEDIAGTLPSVWHRPLGDREADVQVDGWSVVRSGFEATATLDLVIPAGRWTDVAP